MKKLALKKLAVLSSVAMAALLVAGQPAPAQSENAAPQAQQAPEARGERGGERSAPSARPERAPSSNAATPRDRGAQSRDGTPSPAAKQAAEPASPSRNAEDRKDRKAGGEEKRNERRARDNDGDRERRQDRARSQKQDDDATRSRDDAAQQKREQRQDRRTSDRDRDGDRNRASSTERERTTTETERRRSDDRNRDEARRERGSDTEVRISERDRSRVSASFSTTIDRVNVAPVSRSRVSVSIGARVPADVRVYDVPADVVTIYPRFRGHKFVVVDEEIVILHPQRREIVATLPRSGARQARAATTGARSGSFSVPQDRRVEIRNYVMERQVCRYEQRLDFSIGIPLPRTVEICEFPDELVTDIPEIRAYRYVVRDDRVLVVDPDGYEVVDIIE